MAKWFSFNQQTQRVEEITPSEDLFNSSPLLFWSRGMEEWVPGTQALQVFLNPPVHVVAPVNDAPVVDEKKQKIGPFYKKDEPKPLLEKPAIELVVKKEQTPKQDLIKPLSKKPAKKVFSKKSKKNKIMKKKQRNKKRRR